MGFWLDAWNKVCGLTQAEEILTFRSNDIKYVSKYPTREFWSFYVS